MLANLTYVFRDFNELLHSRKKLCHTRNFYFESFFGLQFQSDGIAAFVLWLLPYSGAQNIFLNVHRDVFANKNGNWSNSEVTIHLNVTYYCIDGKKHHLSLVIISEKLTHNASSVHLFNTRLVKYLKRKNVVCCCKSYT